MQLVPAGRCTLLPEQRPRCHGAHSTPSRPPCPQQPADRRRQSTQLPSIEHHLHAASPRTTAFPSRTSRSRSSNNNNNMTAELNRLANDPNFVVEFAVGEPVPNLVQQNRDAGPRFSGLYFKDVKRYVLKSAHMSREDVRIFDKDTGRVVLVSHHPGKDPYGALDPLGMSNASNRHKVAGGEWESVCDVTARARGLRSFKIRPKALSRHGRQFVKVGDNVILNVGKIGKFATMSFRDQFAVGAGEDGDAIYKCVADMTGRTVRFVNQKEELVAQMAKTNKALIMTAALGSGSESTIDIAPGVDCSVILATVYAMMQVGEHFMADVFSNFVMDPVKDSVVDSAVDAAGLGGVVNDYTRMSNQARRQTGAWTRTSRFVYNNFFK